VNTCWTAIPAITLTLVLLGAPITNLFGRTLLCATHMAILTTFPMIYVHGLRLQACREVVALMRPMDEVYGALIGTLVGAWFGAIPTALDW
jgi:phosphatidylinositol glycan class F